MVGGVGAIVAGAVAGAAGATRVDDAVLLELLAKMPTTMAIAATTPATPA